MSARFVLVRALPLALAVGGLTAYAAPAFAQSSEDEGGEDGKGDKDGDKKKSGATKADYELDTTGTTAEIAVQGDGTLAIHIQPAEGLKVHPQAPLEVRLTPTAGLKPAKRKLGRKDVTEPEAPDPKLTCDLLGEKAGEHAVEAELSFFLCSDTWCQRMKDKVTVPVMVKDK